MDPFVMLKADHKEVSALFEKLEHTTERGVKSRTELFETLSRELDVHMLVEETVLYPLLKSRDGARALSFEAVEEHNVAKMLLQALIAMPVDSEEWTAKLAVLKENVEHHIREEENELFPKAREELSPEEQVLLAERLAAEKARVLAVLEGGGVPVVPTTDEPGELGIR